MKNVIGRFIDLKFFRILLVCLFFSEINGSSSVDIIEDQSQLHFRDGRVPIVGDDVQKLGLFSKNNVLWCEEKKYANWFFPVERLNGCVGFFDIANRRRPGLLNGINLNFRSSALEEDQRKALHCYLGYFKSYLAIMKPFYPAGCSWGQECDKAEENLSSFMEQLDNGAVVRDIKNDLKNKSKMQHIWNCVHTEPLCVFDKLNGNSVRFSENPVQMYSRFKPCSRNRNRSEKFDCEEMLQKVAERIGCPVMFYYYYQ